MLWFTGLSGRRQVDHRQPASRRSSHARGRHTYLLDGDNVRLGLNKDLGFTDADRVENIRRVGEVAKLMVDAGLIVLCAFISPFRAERQLVRELVGAGEFVEIFVDTPLEVCERARPQGPLRQGRSGGIAELHRHRLALRSRRKIRSSCSTPRGRIRANWPTGSSPFCRRADISKRPIRQ